jgi:hypothetical protein
VLVNSAAKSDVATAQTSSAGTWSDAPRGSQRHDMSLLLCRPSARPVALVEGQRPNRALVAAGPPSNDGVEHAVVRATVPLSLPPTAVPPHMTARRTVAVFRRHRQVQRELLLIVRRAEWASMVTATRAPVPAREPPGSPTSVEGPDRTRAGPPTSAPHRSSACPFEPGGMAGRPVRREPRSDQGDIDDQC